MSRFCSLVFCIGLVIFSGCSAYHDLSLSISNHKAAHGAWRARKHGDAYYGLSWGLRDHFGHGFIQGYIDVAEGASGAPPLFPPQCYWGSKYQSPEGHAKIRAWFQGYQEGAAAAFSQGVADRSKLPTSWAPSQSALIGHSPPAEELPAHVAPLPLIPQEPRDAAPQLPESSPTELPQDNRESTPRNPVRKGEAVTPKPPKPTKAERSKDSPRGSDTEADRASASAQPVRLFSPPPPLGTELRQASLEEVVDVRGPGRTLIVGRPTAAQFETTSPNAGSPGANSVIPGVRVNDGRIASPIAPNPYLLRREPLFEGPGVVEESTLITGRGKADAARPPLEQSLFAPPLVGE